MIHQRVIGVSLGKLGTMSNISCIGAEKIVYGIKQNTIFKFNNFLNLFNTIINCFK